MAQDQDVEKPWTDNRIRWEEDDHSLPPPEEEDNDRASLDPFREDPRASFSFRFMVATETPVTVELQGYKYESDEIYKSTGLTLWRAAEFLGEYIAAEASSFVYNRRILELGAGLGLCGILAHRIGDSSTSVVCTDGDTEALAKLRENVALNMKVDGGSITCKQLLWGKDSAETFLVSQGCRFDVILASDVVYVPGVIAPLFATVRTLLNQDGNFILAFKKRDVPVSKQMVLDAGTDAGFSYFCPSFDTPEGLFLYVFRLVL